MSRILWIDAEGHVANVWEKPNPDAGYNIPTLEQMQQHVGGLIEIRQCIVAGQPCDLVFNEEGLIHNLPINWLATALFHAHAIVNHGSIPTQPIVGPVILFIGVRVP